MEKDEEGRRWKQKADDKRDQYLKQKVMEVEQACQKAQGEENPSASLFCGKTFQKMSQFEGNGALSRTCVEL